MAELNEKIIKDIQQGKDVSQNLWQLYRQNQKLIIKQIKKSHIDNEFFYDALQDAFLCMVKAAQNFNTEARFKFSTFFVECLKGVISDYQYRHSVCMTIPRSLRGLFFKIYKYQNEYYLKNNKEASVEVIAKALNVSVEDVTQALTSSQTSASLQSVISDEDDKILLQDIIADEHSLDEMEKIEKSDIPSILHNAIRTLPPDIAKSIILYFYQGLSYQKIAEELKIPYRQVSANIGKGIKELRKNEKILSLRNCY